MPSATRSPTWASTSTRRRSAPTTSTASSSLQARPEVGALADKVALVTGAARAQGRSHAVRFAQEGADVIVFDVCGEATEVGYATATVDDLKETVQAIEALDRRVVSRVGDVRDQSALDDVVADGVAELGRLDVVVANAGVSTWGRFWEMPEQRWLDMIDINLTGVWRTLRAAT